MINHCVIFVFLFLSIILTTRFIMQKSLAILSKTNRLSHIFFCFLSPLSLFIRIYLWSSSPVSQRIHFRHRCQSLVCECNKSKIETKKNNNSGSGDYIIKDGIMKNETKSKRIFFWSFFLSNLEQSNNFEAKIKDKFLLEIDASQKTTRNMEQT